MAAAAEHRTLGQRILGRQPTGLGGPLSSAQERAFAHLERHSVWLQNSVRGAAGLSVAVLIADLTSVQHSFWVVLGALSVLRSNALATGQNALRGLLGTVVGFVLGAALLAPIGTHTAALWALLPLAILVAGVAPTAVSFAAGQAAFTVTILILFNIIAPEGWRLGLVRIEDVALGCAVSLVVGLLFWPRGASAALGQALSEAYNDAASYLARAVGFGLAHGEDANDAPQPPIAEAARAAAASRRLDTAYRGFLAERGAKPVALAQVTGLVTGASAVRLTADAVLDLWRRDPGGSDDAFAAARAELTERAQQMVTWYGSLANSFVGAHAPPVAALPDDDVEVRLVAALGDELTADDEHGHVVRVVWTSDHLEAVRRLQNRLVASSPAAADGAE